jgi:dihydroneopterin aldolase
LLKINIDNLTFKCIVGILPIERKIKQKVIIDISFYYFYDKKSQNIIDYTKVIYLMKKLMKKNKYGFLEDAIIDIRQKIKKKFKIKKLKLKIKKPNIVKNCEVSVEK